MRPEAESIQFEIVKRNKKYYVISKTTGRNLGGPYSSEKEAKKRMKQVDWFRYQSKKKSKMENTDLRFKEFMIKIMNESQEMPNG